jgi:hypothetical protein
MKCRPLRRRYILLKCSEFPDDRDVISAFSGLVQPRLQLKIILKEPPYLLLRTDNISLETIKPRLESMVIRCGNAELRPMASSGTIKKARERIKTMNGNYEGVGMRKPSQSNRIKRC